MVQVTFDVNESDAIYLIKFAQLMKLAKAYGEIEPGESGYLEPTARNKVLEIKKIID